MTRPRRDTRGSALIVVLLALGLVLALGMSWAWIAMSETSIAESFALQLELLYAADAAVDRTRVGACAPGFFDNGTAFSDATLTPRLADGTVLDLRLEGQHRQAESDRRYGPMPDAPQWRLVSHASLAAIIPAALPPPHPYVAVWLSDDPGDGDGDPSRDVNGRFLLLGAAYGQRGALRIVEVGVRCPAHPVQAAAALEFRRELR